jgi:cytochrome c1
MWSEILFVFLLFARGPVQAPADRGEKALKENCLGCHDMHLIEQQRLARPKWNREVEKMIRWGAPVPEADKEALVDYLFKQYPDSECPPNKSGKK